MTPDQKKIVIFGSDQWKNIYKGVAPSLSTGDKIYGKKPNSEGNTVYTLL